VSKLSKSQILLRSLEEKIKNAGVRLGYERLQFAGLRLRSGLCWFKGDYYLFVDRRKSVAERIELLDNALQDLSGQTSPAAPEAGDAASQEAEAEPGKNLKARATPEETAFPPSAREG
jgi:hypothetical protein